MAKGMFIVVVCRKCGNLVVADQRKKSRLCAYCGKRILTARARHLGSANTAREAAELVQFLKMHSN